VGVATSRSLLIQVHMLGQLLLIGVGVLLTVIAVISMAGGLAWADAVFGCLSSCLHVD